METKNYSNIEFLLNQFLEGKASINEKQQLYNLIADSQNENSFKQILFRHLTEYNEDQLTNEVIDFDQIYGNITYEIKQIEIHEAERFKLIRKTKSKRILFYSSSIAAVFIIAFFFGRLLTISKKNNLKEPAIAINYNEIKAPLGSKSEITLPDGTKVMLNAGSILKYRSDFNLNNRDLFLKGEGYFKVAKNANFPLYVNAGNISIKAVGTEFNVKAYDEEGIIETTLIEGKVKITQIEKKEGENQYLDLNPNQKAIYIKETASFALEKIKDIDSSLVLPAKTIFKKLLISQRVDINQTIAWTEGKLIIRSEKLDNLCVDLQRKYDVNFKFNNEEIKNYRFSGILLDETLEQVLNVIKLTAPISYYLEGKTVFLTSDKEQVKNYSKHLK
jgi:transmembrane sensor